MLVRRCARVRTSATILPRRSQARLSSPLVPAIHQQTESACKLQRRTSLASPSPGTGIQVRVGALRRVQAAATLAGRLHAQPEGCETSVSSVVELPPLLPIGLSKSRPFSPTRNPGDQDAGPHGRVDDEWNGSVHTTLRQTRHLGSRVAPTASAEPVLLGTTTMLR